jgi:hypothetical protein
LIYASNAAALERGPILANNILGGAASGALAGLAVGSLAYGLDHNYHPQYLVSGTVYGFLGGALLGGGVGVYEISTQRSDTGYTLSQYLAGGTGIGAMLGLVVATIPYLRDGSPEDFMIGLGLGGVIGASLGLTVAIVDINARGSEGGKLLSGEVGLLSVASTLPQLRPESRPEQLWNCQLARFRF